MAKRKSVTERLAALERQVADVRVRAVEAGEFRLVDRSGRIRAMLELSRSGPRLVMVHEDGTVALELMLTREGPGVRLADEAGDTRVFMGATRGTARIGMADRDGSQRVFLGVGNGGEPVLTMYDGSQRKVWTTDAASAQGPAPDAKKARRKGRSSDQRGRSRP